MFSEICVVVVSQSVPSYSLSLLQQSVWAFKNQTFRLMSDQVGRSKLILWA